VRGDDLPGIARKLNPLSKDSALYTPGSKLNGILEDNARLAHFLSKLDETGDAILARRSTAKYLFDYGDLTPFERNGLRRVVRFYTYMRKNTPLIISELAHQPGKFAALEHVRKGAAQDIEGPLPKYMIEAGAIPVAGHLFAVDTPLSSAMDTITPALQVMAVVPGVREFLPPEVRPDEGISEAAKSVLNLPSGGAIEVFKFMAEEAFREDLFTGAEIKDQSGSAVADRFLGAVSPLWSKGENTIRKLSDEDRKRAALVSAITGLRIVQVTPGTQLSEQYRQLELVQRAMDQLRAEGVEVPTIKQLQDAGILQVQRSTTPRSPRRSPAQRRQEALAALAEMGAGTAESP